MKYEVNDVVQIVPTHKWGGCFVTITEVKKWGVQGYVSVPQEGLAFIRLKYEEIEKVGQAIFVNGESFE